MNGYRCEEDIIQNLKDAGCEKNIIECFMENIHSGRQKQAVQVLQKHRGGLLCNLHKEQMQLDCLDYLLYMLKKQNNK